MSHQAMMYLASLSIRYFDTPSKRNACKKEFLDTDYISLHSFMNSANTHGKKGYLCQIQGIISDCSLVKCTNHVEVPIWYKQLSLSYHQTLSCPVNTKITILQRSEPRDQWTLDDVDQNFQLSKKVCILEH